MPHAFHIKMVEVASRYLVSHETESETDRRCEGTIVLLITVGTRTRTKVEELLPVEGAGLTTASLSGIDKQY